ncbi:hypothetical protein M9980_06410 [Sphingomonas donggukensis]|uniref:YtxH domain-containing protein n=1 Tax=Sphingomonas donggukensis TaxID=2949093 RepID=A0ABY4TWU2_9SPHN|nr:hypothetical protein [Sphingomonas donggukensis]URW76822.1 hypothetical protein M9980_06410 [Sphingomonas donggukensis]
MATTKPTNSTAQAKTGKRTALKDAADGAFDRARSTVKGLESNPVGVLVGGLVIGLLAGAFVPRSKQEKTALKGVGKTLAEGATAAFAAAKETGRQQLSGSMLSRDAAAESARMVFDSAVEAAKSTRSGTKAA